MEELKYQILYIDDEPDNLRTFRATFRWEYNVFIAKSAYEGFDVLENNEIHLIISDHHMPGLSGLEFFKQIEKNYPEPVRIILTGSREQNLVVRAIKEYGVYKYTTKPWDEPDMQQTIEEALKVYQEKKNEKELIKAI